jgi:hypothetical protein
MVCFLVKVLNKVYFAEDLRVSLKKNFSHQSRILQERLLLLLPLGLQNNW